MNSANLIVLVVFLLLSSICFGVSQDTPTEKGNMASERERQELIAELKEPYRIQIERNRRLKKSIGTISIICSFPDPGFQPCPEGWALDGTQGQCKVYIGTESSKSMIDLKTDD